MTLVEIPTPPLFDRRTDSSRAGTTTNALVIGRPIPLHQDLRSGLVDQGVEVAFRNSDPIGGDTPATLSAPQGEPGSSMPTETIIVTTEVVPTRNGILSRWRDRAAKSEENNRLAAAAVDASSEYSTCRLLVLCDARAVYRAGLEVHNARRLAQRLKYEIEVDGTPVVSTSYLVVGTTSSLRVAMEAIARWCRHETAPIP
ncbi:hypothetical protein [Rhodococcus sp. 1168]|uniref:hypothetical protein n=1 Tax=Rhodococcus sp. 1168 TaxID=2018041 RepID=UPI000A0A0BED|nr:hypothetical protein [Rhodococcus sp. 1168]ORI21226.1 hypothetical protein BJI47_17515 [Rhodococcus sp. 1168]